jgi:hypothetical protein
MHNHSLPPTADLPDRGFGRAHLDNATMSDASVAGVRPSPGGAMCDMSAGTEFRVIVGRTGIAAAGDGRTPRLAVSRCIRLDAEADGAPQMRDSSVRPPGPTKTL